MKALVLGASGLVGTSLLGQLLADNSFSSVSVFVRKSLNIKNLKLKETIFDFNKNNKNIELDFDVIFCCIGSTIKKAGSKEAFWQIDYEIPLKILSLAKSANVNTVCLVSAMGANAKSNVYYNKVKGSLENAITTLGFKSYGIFRPSLLLGDRAEFRLGESIGKYFMLTFKIIIPKKYRAISAFKVANSMVKFVKSKTIGTRVFESDEMQ
jgi:uncharacterized protein YbjT (DUF2867 family)